MKEDEQGVTYTSNAMMKYETHLFSKTIYSYETHAASGEHVRL